MARLRDELLAQGLRVWWDRDLLPGQDWKLEIQRALERSTAVVACFSRETEARGRSGIYPELRDAIAIFREMSPGSVFIIPVRLSNCSIPRLPIDSTRSLGDLQYVDLFPDNQRGQSMRKLVSALKNENRSFGLEDLPRGNGDLAGQHLRRPVSEALTEIRLSLLNAKTEMQVRVCLYSVERILSELPHETEAKILRDDILKALEYERRPALRAAPARLAGVLALLLVILLFIVFLLLRGCPLLPEDVGPEDSSQSIPSDSRLGEALKAGSITSVSTDASDPAPKESYVVAIEVREAKGNILTVQISGTDGFVLTKEFSIGDLERFVVEVPGANQGVKDEITVMLQGGTPVKHSVEF